MKRKNVLVICFTKLSQDPRVQNQLILLDKLGFKTTVIGLDEPNAPYSEFIEVKKRRNSNWQRGLHLIKRIIELTTLEFEPIYWRIPMIADSLKLTLPSFDFVLANEIHALPIGIKWARDKPLIWDAHEYYPGSYNSSFLKKSYQKKYAVSLLKTYLKKVPFMTVSNGIANLYKENFDVNRFFILPNVPLKYDLKVKKVNPNEIKIIAHGNADPKREWEKIFAFMLKLPSRFTLDCILVSQNNTPYLNHLKVLAKKLPRVRLLEKLPMKDLVPFLNQYDLGLVHLPEKPKNHTFALPNKFFQNIQARIALAVPPLVEMKKITSDLQLGFVGNDFNLDSLSNQIANASFETIERFKERCHEASSQFCLENYILGFEQFLNNALAL